MRVGEVWALEQDSLKIDDNGIYYLFIKNSKTVAGIRKLPVPDKILDMVLDTTFPIWQDVTKNAFEKRVRSRLYKIIPKSDIKNVHTLRGTFIQNCINNNINNPHILHIVQEIVGHTKNEKDALTMDTYMKGIELEQLQAAINNVKYKIYADCNISAEAAPAEIDL